MAKWTKVLGGLLLVLGVLVGLGVVKAWAPDRDVDSLKARWAPPPSQFVGLMGMRGNCSVSLGGATPPSSP